MQILYLILLFLFELSFLTTAKPIWPFNAASAVPALEIVQEIEHSQAALEHGAIEVLGKSPSVDTKLLPLESASHLVPAASKARSALAPMVSVIESVIETFKSIYKSIVEKYQDIKDLYRLFYPAKEVMPPPPVRPNTIIGNIQTLWDRRYTPIKDANVAFQKSIISRRADQLIEAKLAWLPDSMKEKTRKWLIKNAPWLFDALCNGKVHPNPRVQQIALDIQQQITKANPTIRNLAIEAICLMKKSVI